MIDLFYARGQGFEPLPRNFLLAQKTARFEVNNLPFVREQVVWR